MRKLLLATVAALGASLGVADAAGLVAGGETAKPEPGTIVVRLNGRLDWMAGVAGSSGDNYQASKNSNYAFTSLARLYPGFDGIAANGLKYGVSLEIRSNQNSNVGGSGNNTNQTLFWRRAYGYFGTDQLGTFRFGQGDGPATLFMLGTTTGFNDGGWDGDAPAFAAANSAPAWPFFDTSVIYANNKVTYLSPSIAGFDFGVSYAPNNAALGNNSNCTGAVAGCDRLASANFGNAVNASQINRAKNTVEAALRYRGAFGPVGLAASGLYVGSGHVLDSGTPPGKTQYDGLNVGDFGAEVTIAGITVGGNIMFGKYNSGLALNRKGGADGLAWIGGVQYATGPIVVGASYFNSKSSGDVAPGQRDEYGIAAGGTYSLVPGVALWLSYLYGERKQGGWDFLAGSAGPAHNQVQAQVFAVGTQLKW